MSFKQFVQDGVEQFVNHFDSDKDCLWLVEVDGQIKGSIAISHITTSQAQLRWYFVEPDLTGRGYGTKLLEKAIQFCIDKHYESITLWTNSKLSRARALYAKYGFQIVESGEQFLSNQMLVTERWLRICRRVVGAAGEKFRVVAQTIFAKGRMKLEIKKGTFSGVGGAQLFYKVHTPGGAPKAAVIAVHGHGDHSGGLHNLSESLAAHDYIVYALDLRGHGKSTGTRGFIRSWEEFRGDLHAFRKLVAAEHPELPLFIAAHSLGGVIALDYGLHHGEGVAGLIAIAPAISYEAKPSEKLLIALMGKLMPEYTIDKPSNLQQLTRDPDMLSRLQADSLRHNTVTPGFGRGLMRTVPRITNQANTMKLPLLLLYGLGDDITPPAKLRQFFDAVGSEDKLKLEYNGMRHRPFDEIGREQVFADILRWLDRQTGTL
ncbi:GNAT family N-acetyltransferase [Paenibacillus allorhizosphaerae]|uniref:GNAT family N-acetyltransferase n=1 Tax=Paenibacillus allorhizosphaerae TaxID=2849866 RepID=UPI0022A8507E